MNGCQLTQRISQLSLKPGEEEIKKKDGGNSGGEYKMTKLTLVDRVNNAFDGDNERKIVDKFYFYT